MTLAEALIAMLVIAVAGLPLLTNQVEGTRRLEQDQLRDAAQSVMDAMMRRFSRAEDLRPFLGAPAARPPWRWSPELTAGLDAALLDAWARDRGLSIRAEVLPGGPPGLSAVRLTARWHDAGARGATHGITRIRLVLEDAHG